MFLQLLAIYVSPRWGLGARGFKVFLHPSSPPGLLEDGAQGISVPISYRLRFSLS